MCTKCCPQLLPWPPTTPAIATATATNRSFQGHQSHNDAEALGLLLLLRRLVRIALHHLPDEILKYVLDLPVLLGRGLVEGQTPPVREFLDCRALNFTFVGEVEFGPDDDYWDVLWNDETVRWG